MGFKLNQNIAFSRRPTPPLLPIHRKLPQFLHRRSFQRPLIRRTQHNLRHLLIIIPAPRIKCLLPPRHAKTPLAPIAQPRLPQIISPASRKVEKLVRHDARDGVVSCVGAWGLAVAGAEEAG